MGSISTIEHDVGVNIIKLSQSCGGRQERRIIYVDQKNEMFMSPVSPIRGAKTLKTAVIKIGTQVESFCWNEKCDILASIADSRMVLDYFPHIAYIDADLMEATKEVRDSSQFGKGSEILYFCGTQILLKGENGETLAASITPQPAMMYDVVKKKEWKNALHLCRISESTQLWAMFIGLSLYHKELEFAEIALGTIQKVDKFQQIKRIRQMPEGVVSL